MKTKFPPTIGSIEPLEDEIRDYAYHLWEQDGCVPGHALDHWLEAKACIMSNIPKHHARWRLQRHLEAASAAGC